MSARTQIALGNLPPFPSLEVGVCEDPPASTLECPLISEATAEIPAPFPEDRASDGLRVVGNQIVFAGQPVRLRGVALGDVDDYARLHRDARRDFRAMADGWKANVVRLSVHPSTWRDHRDQALTTLSRLVAHALAAGLFVIVDYHAIGFPDGYYPLANPSWGTPADLYDSSFALSLDFWHAVSLRIRDPRVMFELWNEPVYQAHERNPGEPDGSRWADLKPYFERLIGAIRANRNDSIVIAAGNHWAYDLKGIRADLLADLNSAYSWHIYSGKEDNDPERWGEALDGLETVRPVVVTEWGFEPSTVEHWRGSADGFGEPFRKGFLEGRGLHSTAWCWNANYGPALLERDWSTRTPLGEFVYEYLTAANEGAVRPVVAREQEPAPAERVASVDPALDQPALLRYSSRHDAGMVVAR